MIDEQTYWLAEHLTTISSEWQHNGIKYETKEDAQSYNRMRQELNHMRRRVTKVYIQRESYE